MQLDNNIVDHNVVASLQRPKKNVRNNMQSMYRESDYSELPRFYRDVTELATPRVSRMFVRFFFFAFRRAIDFEKNHIVVTLSTGILTMQANVLRTKK